MNRGGQRGDLLPKHRPAKIPRRIGADIDEQRLHRQRPRHRQHRRRGIRNPRIKTLALLVPLQMPGGQHQQQLVTASALKPITDLLVDPMRRRRPRRQRHNEKPRAIQRLGDLAPQIRAGRQIGVIAKHPQRPQLTQPAPDTVQTLLNPRNHRPIPMGIRQKRVVVQRRHLPRRRGTERPALPPT